MSEDVKPEQWKLILNKEFAEWRVCQGEPYNDNDFVKVIELEPTMRLMDEMYDVIKNHNCFKGTTYFDGEDRVITECKTCDILEKYKKFKDGLK